jgi:hypothetical protein
MAWDAYRAEGPLDTNDALPLHGMCSHLSGRLLGNHTRQGTGHSGGWSPQRMADRVEEGVAHPKRRIALQTYDTRRSRLIIVQAALMTNTP